MSANFIEVSGVRYQRVEEDLSAAGARAIDAAVESAIAAASPGGEVVLDVSRLAQQALAAQQAAGGSGMIGTLTLPSGSRYEGTILGGKPHGTGTLFYPTGDPCRRVRYAGSFSNGLREGQGRLEFCDGKVKTGYFIQDHLNGRGFCSWPDGRKYEGQFQEGSLWGQGSLRWPDGMVYAGEFSNDWINGNGKLTFCDGGFKKGFFVNGQLINGCFLPSLGSHMKTIENGKETCCSSSGCDLVGQSCVIL